MNLRWVLVISASRDVSHKHHKEQKQRFFMRSLEHKNSPTAKLDPKLQQNSQEAAKMVMHPFCFDKRLARPLWALGP